MSPLKIDAEYLIISAVVSLAVTVAIVYMIKLLQPELIMFKGGTVIFIYIGVFTANLIIEARRQRLEKHDNE